MKTPLKKLISKVIYTAVMVSCLLLILLLFSYDAFLPTESKQEPNSLIVAFHKARHIKNYLQPPEDLLQLISSVYTPEEKNRQVISKDNIVLVNDVPFFKYWQDVKERYVFHPMAYGGFLSRLSCDEPIKKYLSAAKKTAYRLPNGGLLWYYPDNFNLNRFLGPDISPSAIGQAQILGAIVDLDRRCNLNLKELARETYLGLAFPYYQGGVNLKDSFLLELPLFRSAPEVILNGWLHALLYLHQYATFYNDSEALELFRKNIFTLAQVLPSFHDSTTGLSLYSDLCPYRVRIYHPDGPPDNLYVFYKSRLPELDDLVFKLELIKEDSSSYDNRIIKTTSGWTDIWISCSQRYDTYLIGEGKPFSVEFNVGEYDPYQTTPAGGETVKLQSKKLSNYSVVHITSVRDKLFCGYPTNFSKFGIGKNYYHTYHVVALVCLLASADLPEEVYQTLKFWMHKWMQTIENWNSGKKLVFYDYQYVLKELYEHRAFLLTDNWNALLHKIEASSR